MQTMTHGRKYVDDPFNEFGLVDMWHGVIAAFEFGL
ncbi:hypothetical protein NKDENANG_03671 [Candidatus Entotheonellaceae bacterium PAL068K]